MIVCKRWIAGFVLAALVRGGLSARGNVILDPNHTSIVYDTTSGGDSSLTVTSLPPPVTTDQVNGSTASAYTSLSLSAASGFSILVSDYGTNYFGGSPGAGSSHGALYFQATDQTTTYLLNGKYNYSGYPGSSSTMAVSLLDVTTGQTIGAFSEQSSGNAQSGTFTVGDSNGTTTGTLSGMLQQNDVYEFQYAGNEQAPPPQFGPSSSGNGTLGISFSDAAQVPEPQTGWLLAVGAVASVYRKRIPQLKSHRVRPG